MLVVGLIGIFASAALCWYLWRRGEMILVAIGGVCLAASFVIGGNMSGVDGAGDFVRYGIAFSSFGAVVFALVAWFDRGRWLGAELSYEAARIGWGAQILIAWGVASVIGVAVGFDAGFYAILGGGLALVAIWIRNAVVTSQVTKRREKEQTLRTLSCERCGGTGNLNVDAFPVCGNCNGAGGVRPYSMRKITYPCSWCNGEGERRDLPPVGTRNIACHDCLLS